MYPQTCQRVVGEKETARVVPRRMTVGRQRSWVHWLRLMACVGGLLSLAAPVMGQAPDFTWATKGGGAGQDFGRGVTVDGEGNVIVTGSFNTSATFGGNTLTGENGFSSAYVAKYGNNGSLVWAKRVSPPSGNHAFGYAVTAGSSGDVFMTGTSPTSASAGWTQTITVKYDPSGNVRWSHQGSGQLYSTSYGKAVAVAQDGSAYVAGYFGNAPVTFGATTLTSSGSYDVLLIKYDGTGNVLWARRAGGLSDDVGSCLAVDLQGNILLGGMFLGNASFGTVALLGSNTERESFIAKCDSNGNFLWAKRIPGNTYFDDYRGIATDAQGNAYLTGAYFNNFNNSFPDSGFVAKFDTSGSVIWTKPVAGAVASIGMDSLGNPYIGGSFSGSIALDGKTLISSGAIDTFIYKLNPSGTAIWAKQAGFIFDDIGNGLAVDPAGNIFLTGTFHDTTRFDTNLISGNGEDVFIAKLGNNTVPLVPFILAQPQSQSVSPGATATFGVVASGAPPLRFRWRFNGANLPAGTNAVLNVTNALLADVGTYDVVVSNAAGVVISSPATLTLVPGAPSLADSFSGRGILIGFTNFVTGNNTAYTREPGEPDHAGRKGAHSAWLTWTAPDNGSCVMDTFGSSFDTVLAVYTGGSVSNLAPVTANDDASPDVLQSRVAFSAVAGVDYQIAVDGYSTADAGNIAFHLSFSNSAPIITFQPQNRSAVTGSNATFSVTALGIPPLSYQWRFNGSDIAGATDATRTISNVQPVNEGGYSVVVANSFGAVTSTVATLTVLQPPSITALSSDQTVVAGNAVTFEVSAAGTSPLSYQWYFKGTNLAGAFQPTLIISGVQRPQAGPYTVVVSNPFGSVTSSVVNLTVHYSLTLSTNGNGSVSRAPDLSSYPPVSVVTLTATPAPGAFFVNWSGNASGTNNPLSVLMTSNKVITANFAATSLTLGTQGPGSIAKSPDRPFYSVGEQVTLLAAPARWHAFARWVDGPTANPRVITIGPSNSYTAIFTPTQALETVTFDGVTRTAPVGMPAVFVDGVFVVSGTVTNFDTAQVEILSSFSNETILFTLDGTPPGFASTFYDGPFAVRQTSTVRAIAFNSDFTQSLESDAVDLHIVQSHSLTVSTSGGGAMTRSPDVARYLSGSMVTLNAVPDAGWSFVQWLGDASGTNPTATVTLNRDKCVQAVFGTALSTTTVGSGLVMVNPQVEVQPHGTAAWLTAVPQPGNYFALWGGAASSTNNPLQISITNAQPSVTAVFQPLNAGQHSLAILSDGFGMVTNRPRGNRFSAGASVTLTALLDAGQSFLGWSGDASGTQNPLTVTLNSSKVITAQFTKRPALAVQPCSEPSLEDGFQFLISGEFGARYLVEKSGDGQAWLPLATVTNLFGVTQFNDTTATNAELRMYRAAPALP